jgi:tryptophan synthase alpha subunit
VLTDPTMGGVSASFAFLGDVVIGSRLVQLLESAAPEGAAAELKTFIAELRAALDGAGKTAR